MIKEWISNKGDYDLGLLLYAKWPLHNRNTLKYLQGKESLKKREKLNYVLSKVPESITPINIEVTEINFKSNIPNIKIEEPGAKAYRPLQLKDLPKELHPLYIKQKSDYPTACSLKMQLNDLAPEQEAEALELCIKIERLFDSIEKSWQIFDHWTEHKVILKIEETDYSKKTPVELLKAEKNKRQLIAKAKKRIEVLNNNLKTTEDKLKKLKIKRQIESKNEARIKHEMELEQIIEFNNKK